MTLHTRMAAMQPFPVRELLDYVNAELLRAKDPEIKDEDNTKFDLAHFEATKTGEKNEKGIEIGERRWIPDGTRQLGNRLGQGFGAWFWMDYRPDGMLRDKPVYYDENEDETEEPVVWKSDGQVHPSTWHIPMCVEINFDTTYGYKVAGAGCADLHAYMIIKIGEWLDARQIDWYWFDEFRGEWHHQLDDGKLEQFGTAERGRAAVESRALV